MIRIQRLRDNGNWIQMSTLSKTSDGIINHTIKSIAKQKMFGYTNTVRAIDDSGNLINIYTG
jgi:hypothetical protein